MLEQLYLFRWLSFRSELFNVFLQLQMVSSTQMVMLPTKQRVAITFSQLKAFSYVVKSKYPHVVICSDCSSITRIRSLKIATFFTIKTLYIFCLGTFSYYWYFAEKVMAFLWSWKTRYSQSSPCRFVNFLICFKTAVICKVYWTQRLQTVSEVNTHDLF